MEETNTKIFSKLVEVDLDQTSKIDEIHNNFKTLKERLEIINELEVSDKLGCDVDGNYYIDKNAWGQFLKRQLYKQSRSKTSEDLKKDFQALMKVFDNYLDYIKKGQKGLLMILLQDYSHITVEMTEFIVKIVKGLYNLKQTYPENEDIVARIDSIILTLCESKERLEESNNKGVINMLKVKRSRAFSD
jgi:hypothetical protein